MSCFRSFGKGSSGSVRDYTIESITSPFPVKSASSLLSLERREEQASESTESPPGNCEVK